MGARRLYRASAVLSGGLVLAAFGAGIFFSIAREGGLPALDISFLPAVESLVAEGRDAEALRELRAAATLDTNNPGALLLLADVSERQGDHATRIRALRLLIQGHEDDVGLRLELADALLDQSRGDPSREGARRRIERAALNAEAALRSDPRSAAAHELLGEASLLLGDREAAARHWAEAVRIDPERREARRELERVRAGEPS